MHCKYNLILYHLIRLWCCLTVLPMLTLHLCVVVMHRAHVITYPMSFISVKQGERQETWTTASATQWSASVRLQILRMCGSCVNRDRRYVNACMSSETSRRAQSCRISFTHGTFLVLAAAAQNCCLLLCGRVHQWITDVGKRQIGGNPSLLLLVLQEHLF